MVTGTSGPHQPPAITPAPARPAQPARPAPPKIQTYEPPAPAAPPVGAVHPPAQHQHQGGPGNKDFLSSVSSELDNIAAQTSSVFSEIFGKTQKENI